MTQVDVYFHAADLLQVAQRLIAKVLVSKQHAVVTADAPTLAALHAHLWAFDACQFVPHVLIGSSDVSGTNASARLAATQSPIILASLDAAVFPSHDGLLINLGLTVPAQFASYQRLLDLVGTDEASKAAGRERFKFYKARGYPLKTLDLSSKQ